MTLKDGIDLFKGAAENGVTTLNLCIDDMVEIADYLEELQLLRDVVSSLQTVKRQ